ncbi:hypothetical protein Q4555_10250 [Octadecabacter sp. 1_MG-2023]|uniref:hypothetical protein n=1 Tax=unclassified Octadecabacter TaxID=196158 RepID=UPI001C095FB0|nr:MULTISPECIES: hypothetical protein [unclassified Octadecabacter]MBU2992190.1 hypothetical protein [Octadecabacter sp. B2R22]MDO6735054.1 hypothetical protein [Octadecabacter sp. 1_MG-2023]
MFARTLKKTFTAGILASSMALTSIAPSSAQAGMSEEEVFGLLSLLVIGAAIHHSRNDDPAPSPQVNRTPRAESARQVLPSSCRRDIETRRRGTVRMFTQRCLNNNYRNVDRLPQACHITVRTQNGQQRQGYSAQCLRNAGFRTTRH